MSFSNVYYKRTAGTERPCFCCDKATTTVLATINAVDFLYTCDDHLKDFNFATALENDGTVKPVISEEEIAKVAKEYEAKQKEKKEKEKEKEKEKAKEKDKDKDKDKEQDKDKEDSSKKPPNKPKSTSPVSIPAVPAPQVHQKYALHRDFFAMRQAAHRKRRQASQAKALAPRLPGAPRSSIS